MPSEACPGRERAWRPMKHVALRYPPLHDKGTGMMNNERLLRQTSRILLCGLLLLSWGCVHRIHVTPAPPTTAPVAIAQSVEVLVPFLAIEGADHMPGIPLLEWPAQDLRAAVIDYIRARRTFAQADGKQADLTLTVKAWLRMRSRGNYRYKLRLETTLGPAKTLPPGAGLNREPAPGPAEQAPIKSYLVEKDAEGANIRWVTASDQIPIAETVQAALDDLLTQIEADHLLYRKEPR